MMRHLLQLAWNRKRQNLLLTAEILLSFVVVFAVLLAVMQYASNWRQPLGFDIDRIWAIEVSPAPAATGEQDGRSRTLDTFREIIAMLESLPNVERTAGAWPSVPYENDNWSTSFGLQDGRAVGFGAGTADDGFAEILQMRLLAGRWFSQEDDAAAWEPVVLNQRLAREIFGDRDPLNQIIPVTSDYEQRANVRSPRRVIGIVEDYRYRGEFGTPSNFAFFRMRLSAPVAVDELPPIGAVPGDLLVRVTDDTTAAFEETLARSLAGVAPDWSFAITPLSSQRAATLQAYATPLALGATVAGFLLLMVALGLTGVVWQSVTARRREFGLRRAQGATAGDVRRQVVAELLLLTSAALAIGVAVVVQIPVLPLEEVASEIGIPVVGPPVWLTSVVVAVGVIYLLTLLCGWYPSRLATKIQPAEALHYE